MGHTESQKKTIDSCALLRLTKDRPQVIQSLTRATTKSLDSYEKEMILAEALYTERSRLRNQKFKFTQISTLPRRWRDQKMWGSIHSGLLKSSGEVDRTDLLERVIKYYGDEIAGRFSPRVYDFATSAVPYGFNWLLNAASVKRFLPWKLTKNLESSLFIEGEVETLRKLEKKGTVLLVPTHQSNIDSILIGYLIYLMGLPPFAYGAGLNLFSNPILSFFMGNLGAYTVDRLKSNLIYKTTLKNYSMEILKRGTHSIFFPGGGRSRSGAIESQLKLGLLGTGLKAQIENYKREAQNPNIYIVPMVTSYHFVLEARSLIENYLIQEGKHRFVRVSDDSGPAMIQVFRFFWKFFSSQSNFTVRIGRPLDVFGNSVDEEGRSLDLQGRPIDPKKWLTTLGKLDHNLQRDEEYTKRLGEVLVDRFYEENVVLSSHWVAFSYLRALRKKYPDLDLYRFLRLSKNQTTIPFERFSEQARAVLLLLKRKEGEGKLHLSEAMRTQSFESLVQTGLKRLGNFHGVSVVEKQGELIWSGQMNLLYYYRNRLSGYGLSVKADQGHRFLRPGEKDEQGFLA
ncbi:MAG: acyltransferase [Bdellovibrionaceae bacterium]|nr:acyltransferase [Pseudobdellovibrionaceae bacterium]